MHDIESPEGTETVVGLEHLVVAAHSLRRILRKAQDVGDEQLLR